MHRNSFTEIGVSVLITMICAVFLVQALKLPPGRFEPLGSGPVPTWTAAIVILSCLVVIAKAIMRMRNSGAIASDPPQAASRPVGGLVMMALSIAYVAALQYRIAGFAPLTAIYLVLLILAMEGFRRSAILPAVVTAVIAAYGAAYLFTQVLVVDLPV